MREKKCPPARKLRTDGLRNRDLLLAAAQAAFAEMGADVPPSDVAKRAGVGIGTLYRHFPTRDELVAAVYERDVERLSESADTLLKKQPADEALALWLERVIDYVAAKRMIVHVLQANPNAGAQLYGNSEATLSETLRRLVDAAQAAGTIRAEISFEDVARMMAGICSGNDRLDWEASARRLLGVMMAGLRATL
ncbi:MAG: TetR/AcrR family transcriptional regulator [Sphingobium sp.]